MNQINNTHSSPSLKNKGFVAVLLCTIALLLITWWGIRSRLVEQSYDNNHLIVEEKQLDFGTGWEGQELRWSFEVVNQTRQTIKIERWFAKCSCTNIEPKSLQVEPGKSAQVTATIKLPQILQDTAIGAEFSVAIKPEIESPLIKHEGWTIKGRVQRLLQDSPRLVWKEPLIAGRTADTKTAKVKFQVPVKSCSIKYDEQFLNSATISRIGDSDIEFLVTATLKKNLQVSDVVTHLIIAAQSDNFSDLPVVAIPVVASIVNDVYALPSIIPFGILRMGETAKMDFSIVSRTNSPFTIIDILPLDDMTTPKSAEKASEEEQSDQPTFNLTQLSGLAPSQDERNVFRITVTNTKGGNHLAKYRFRILQADQSEYDIDVRATYTSTPKVVHNNE